MNKAVNNYNKNMESNPIQDSEDNNKKLNINKKNEKSETERKEMIKKKKIFQV